MDGGRLGPSVPFRAGWALCIGRCWGAACSLQRVNQAHCSRGHEVAISGLGLADA